MKKVYLLKSFAALALALVAVGCNKFDFDQDAYQRAKEQESNESFMTNVMGGQDIDPNQTWKTTSSVSLTVTPRKDGILKIYTANPIGNVVAPLYTTTATAGKQETFTVARPTDVQTLYAAVLDSDGLIADQLAFTATDAEVAVDMTIDATKVRHWSDSRYDYTETSFYLVTADGEMSFQRIPVDGSRRMDNALMDSIEPFDYGGLQPFAPGYLSGFLADRFDENADDCLPRATNRVRNSVAEVFREAVDEGFTTMTPSHSNIQLSDTAVAYALFPVFLVSSTYKGQRYQFALNGQTGKMTGNLPISKAKSALFFFGTLAGVFAVITAVLTLL